VTDEPFQLAVASSAERSLSRLPAKVAAAVVEFMVGPLLDTPHRVGHPLRRELTGLWSARRGAYRIIYEIDDATRTVGVVRIEHRADVYRPR
jgi:mRNA interferase RelE/StbE